MQQLEYFFQCPHCWEQISILLEQSSGPQSYIEDCEVCCNPLLVDFTIEAENIVSFTASEAQ
ncbi:CPXCG motif-containing cysteine-rich protein [Ichthyenterobacterium sp. W332]|uniref:CPXCG motif-containing cysteine-rich protein n=1 Tax=Microcosmobacter mediterraneus TaxID=3075607 RepID=A0ABU2YJD0_9FLAO|nr:CPXCG motif-containing cysteine-rich protein [Ichthyenterobacterium sp. W332]MDT0558277.1 CPXCG motif-containing cysteine-rich protein [Ichthyenterobacterium sp. W332]